MGGKWYDGGMAKKTDKDTRKPNDKFNVDRIIRSAKVPAGQLLAHPENFRIHGELQAGMVESTIKDVGWVRRVLVNENTGRVIDGHLRVTNAMKRGENTPVPVDYVSLTEEEEMLVLSMLDESGRIAFVDTVKRDELIDRLKEIGLYKKSVSTLVSAIENRKVSLVRDAELAIQLKGSNVSQKDIVVNNKDWMEITLIIRRADKEFMFDVLDEAKSLFKLRTQSDALMKILKGWRDASTKS